MLVPQADLPLTDRPGDAVLFRIPGRSITAASFAADALELARALPPSGHVLNLCTGRYAFAVGFAAALVRGLCSLLTSDRSADALGRLGRRYPGCIALFDTAGPHGLPGVHVAPRGTGTAAIPAIAAGQAAALVFTSGSTGEPNAHAKSWGSLVARSRAARMAFALDPADPASVVATVPPQHMYGFELTVLLPLHAACAAWCGPAFFPADIRLALEEAAAPRLLVTTPLQMRALAEARVDLPPLARVISATAPLDPAMAGEAEARWGTVVSEIFGATEVGSVASRRTVDGPHWQPYPGVALTQDTSGLLVCAPGLAPTVLDDAVDLLPDGRFRLQGRRSDVVKLAGRRASLAGLNQVLASVAGVLDGVFVPPDAHDHRAGARMTVLVVAPDAPPAAILAGLRDRIDPVFLPRRIVHLDRLPRNEVGKLPAAALRALAG